MKFVWALLFMGMFFSSRAIGLQEIKLELYDAVQDEADETTINLDYGNSNTYHYTEDSKKILSGVLEAPQLFSITSDNVNCLINSNGPFISNQVIPLVFRSYNTGNYTIRLKSTNNLDATVIIRLEDKVTGQMYLLQTTDHTFNLNTQQLNTARFWLHISRPAAITTSDANCSSLNGSITVDQDTTIKWNQCQLFNSENAMVASQSNVTGIYTFGNLPAGNYSVGFIYGSYVATKQVTVNTQQVNVTIGVSTQNIVTGQEVQFSSWATNAQYYDWDFGDGTIITEIANPSLAFYAPGTYTVTLLATNSYGCEGYAYLTIVVSQGTDISEQTLSNLQVYSTGTDVVVANNSYTHPQCAIYNLTGQMLASGALSQGNNRLYLGTQPSGIYIVNITAAEGSLSRKVVLGR